MEKLTISRIEHDFFQEIKVFQLYHKKYIFKTYHFLADVTFEVIVRMLFADGIWEAIVSVQFNCKAIPFNKKIWSQGKTRGSLDYKQKQPSISFLWKRYSDNMHQIYCRAPMPCFVTFLKSHFDMGVLL